MLIVLKFGGSSLSSLKKIKFIAKKIIHWYKNNIKLIIVVSAMGNTTNNLLGLYNKIGYINNSIEREKDLLVSSGEQISCSLLSIFLNKYGARSVSLNSWQIPIFTKGKYGDSKIGSINKTKINKYLKKNYIVIVTGYYGIDSNNNNIHTLGRGGSDYTAIILSYIMNSNFCYIYTDVDGVYNLDPNKFKKAKRIKFIEPIDILELTSNGAKVLQFRSVKNCIKYKVKLKILSSFKNKNMKKDFTSGTDITFSKKNKYITYQKVYFIRCILSNKYRLCNNNIYKIYKISDIISYFKINNNTIYLLSIKLNDSNDLIDKAINSKYNYYINNFSRYCSYINRKILIKITLLNFIISKYNINRLITNIKKKYPIEHLYITEVKILLFVKEKYYKKIINIFTRLL